MKSLLYIIFPLFVIACSDDNINSSLNRCNDSTDSLVKIPFRTQHHSRLFFTEEPVNPLIILRSLEEEAQFFDTTHARTSTFNFSSYDDSLLIVLRSPFHISVSNSFSIDSLIADTSSNTLIIHAQNYFPINKMSIITTHCHVVVIPKLDVEFDYEIKEIFETTDGTIVPFNNFLHSQWEYASYYGEIPFLTTLKSISEQDSFLNEINLYQDFPAFNYSDSMLVGVFSQRFNHVTPFEIVSIVKFADTIKVSSQYLYIGMLPSLEANYHFVSVKKTEMPFVLEPIEGIYTRYE